jgi:hypothetical protein
VAYIGVDEFRFRTCLTDFTDEFLAVFVTPTGNNNLSTFRGKRECRCPSDACQSSCNQHNLVFMEFLLEKIFPPNSESERASNDLLAC